jgi:DNA-binding beta-propeller fold protein YncE
MQRERDIKTFMIWNWMFSAILTRVRARKTSSCLMIFPLAALFALLGCGGGGAGGQPAHQNFLLVPALTGQVAAFAVQQNGALGTPDLVAGPLVGGSIAVSSSSHEAFVADALSGNLFAFNQTQANQILPAPGSPFSLTANPGLLEGVAVRPDGKFAYVVGLSGEIIGLSIKSDGSVGPISGSPFPLPALADKVVTDSSGALLFAVGDFGISVFTIDPTTGALTSAGDPVSMPGPFLSGFGAAAVTPSAKFLYVTLRESNSVAAFSFDLRGKLQPVNGSPFPVGAAPSSLTATAQVVYVLNSGDNTISALEWNSTTGAITPISGSPFNAQGASGDIAVVNGQFLYVPTPFSLKNFTGLNMPAESAVAGFSIDGSGALAPLQGSPFQVELPLLGTAGSL